MGSANFACRLALLKNEGPEMAAKQIPLRPVLIGLIALVAAIGAFSLYSGPKDQQDQKDSGLSSASVDGACTGSGVTFVVDFGESSKQESIVKCAKDFTGSGWDLPAEVGVKMEGSEKYPIGFACRINGYPAEEIQSCGPKPTYTLGYWSYFQANSLSPSTWRLSDVGAAETKPECGDYEGWVFVENAKPEVVPSLPAAAFICQ
ncbi:MAG: hypothetical protein RL174_235 [Actinomycetota bacterium]